MRHKENIFKLRAEGKSYREIQAELGCSKGTIAYHLGENQKERYHQRTNRRRTELSRKIWDIKEKSGCIDCGEKYPHFMLEFDHLPGYEKIESPNYLARTYSLEKAMQEIEKCEIVCANCHKIRTWNRYSNNIGNIV